MPITTGCPRFDADFQRVAELVASEPQSPDELLTCLRAMYAAIFGVDMNAYDAAALTASNPAALELTNNLRLALRDRVKAWSKAGLMTVEVQGALRDVFRAARYATDMLGELLIAYDDMSPGETVYPAFTGPHHNTLAHPDFLGEDGIEFQSGDVLVVRGLLHNSAAIARIGDVDSQFSHVALVHIDERGRRRIVEALIEDGAKISNFNYTLKHALARAVLYRHPDRELAARAAQRIYDRVRQSQRNWDNHIFYDFTMELEGYDKLFCAKLIRQAYDEASHGLLRLPTFPTTFRLASRDFLDRIGVTATTSFAPGDMELESEFQAVAEWRDYRKTSLVRLQDLVMVKLFEWMEQHGYVFRETPGIWILSVLGRASSHLPNVVKSALSFAFPKVPLNMKRETIAAIAMLHNTAQPLLEELKELEKASVKATGRPLHPRDVYAHLDGVEQKAQGRIGYLRKSAKA